MVRVQGVVVVGHGGGHGGGFPLGGTGAQVRDESNAQGVRRVKAFHRSQVPRNFCQALPEANAHEIHGQRMSVKITCKGMAKDALNVEPVSQLMLDGMANPALPCSAAVFPINGLRFATRKVCSLICKLFV